MPTAATAPPQHRPESFPRTVQRLAQAQKPAAAGSPAYSRFVNRRLGRVLAAIAFHAGLTPNQVTAISAACSGAAITLIALAEPGAGQAAAIVSLLLVGYAWDSADGQLARLRGGGSPAGEWLDHVVDSVKTSAVHLAVLVSWFRFGVEQAGPWPAHSGWLLVPLTFTLVAAVFFFVQILTDQLRRAHPQQAPPPAGADLRAVLRSLAVWPTDYGVLCLLFACWAWPQLFVAGYAVLLGGTVAFLALALPRWYGQLRLLGRPA